MKIHGTIQTRTDVGNRSTLSILPSQPIAGLPAIPANNITIVINKSPDATFEEFVQGQKVIVELLKDETRA